MTGFASIVEAAKDFYTSNGRRKISKLGIAVHGDAGGVVEIAGIAAKIPPTEIKNRDYKFLSPYTVYYFLDEFRALNQYLADNAQLIFFSCMAGFGSEGSYLLQQISAKNVLPGKTVIAFTTLAESGVFFVGAPTVAKEAGIVYETGQTVSYDPTDPPQKFPVRKIVFYEGGFTRPDENSRSQTQFGNESFHSRLAVCQACQKRGNYQARHIAAQREKSRVFQAGKKNLREKEFF